MALSFKINAVNQVPKGTILYSEKESISSVGVILKGRVIVHNSGSNIVVGVGTFLGIADLYTGTYNSTYTAYDNLVLYVFDVAAPEDIENIFSINKDYNGIMTASMGRYIIELDKLYQRLQQSSAFLHEFLLNSYKRYVTIGKAAGIKPRAIAAIGKLEPYHSQFKDNMEYLDYYKECGRIPMSTQKAYFGVSSFVASHHVEEQASVIRQYIEECTQLADYNIELFYLLINEGESCLFKAVARLAIELTNSGKDSKTLHNIIDEITDKINQTENLLTDRAGRKLEVNRELMEQIYFRILSGGSKNKNDLETVDGEIEDGNELIEDKVRDSLNRIIEYSECKEQTREDMLAYIKQFKELKDKTAGDDESRRLRKRLANCYYEIYAKVFLKAYKEKETSRVIDMFLNYGFLDETLLSKEKCIELYNLEPVSYQKELCHVYTIKEWLITIYEGKKEPSKSEFDMDYQEYVRDLKKTKQIQAEEESVYIADVNRKLEYEIKNMLQYNNRLVSGQLGTFVPFLYEEAFLGKVENCYLTDEKINTAVDRLRSVDYSVFYRESVYSDVEKGITREYIMQEVCPDIILLPVYGSNAIMWQEISGKRRNTPARFLLPAFFSGNIEEILIRVLGRFRWELCRTIQGPSWNDVSVKSLTSEYSDYIQFYRKNRDLSDEKKEKLKLQIQKCRNNTKEVFAMDYETWIKNEASGAIRLNKQVRELMATYCPFSKELREKVTGQPLFDEAMARYKRDKLKRIKELDLRIRVLEKEEIDIPCELQDTMEFYKEL